MTFKPTTNGAKPIYTVGIIVLALAYAGFGLVACGGGEKAGRPPCDGTYLGQGICIPTGTYTLGGTVSGLVGSGLVVSEIGGGNGTFEPVTIAISANGPFTFLPKYYAGEKYDVLVSAQPADPSQTCVVTNGSGTVANDDITNLSVVCTTGIANASLSGAYRAVYYNYPSENGGLWTVTFDGAGNFSGTDMSNTANADVSSSAVSGTYTLAADGTLNIAPHGGYTITGGLSANGNTLVISQVNAGVAPEILVGVRQGRTNFSIADLTGTYTAAYFTSPGFPNTIDEGGLWTVSFDGAGNFSGTDTLNNHGTVTSLALSGTYTVGADGTLNISPNGGSPITGGLSDDGNVWVASQTTQGEWPEILVGIKLGPTSPSNASLSGPSTAVYYSNTGYGSANDHGGLWTAIFDGTGNFSGNDVINDSFGALNTALSGTYAVAADGTLNISPSGGSTVTGGLGADSASWIASQTTPGQPPSILVGILR